MTELNKWVLIEAGHDEDEYDIDVNIIGVYDSEAEAKEELKTAVDDRYGPEDEDDDWTNDVSWSHNYTKATITDDECCIGWCTVFQIKKI